VWKNLSPRTVSGALGGRHTAEKREKDGPVTGKGGPDAGSGKNPQIERGRKVISEGRMGLPEFAGSGRTGKFLTKKKAVLNGFCSGANGSGRAS